MAASKRKNRRVMNDINVVPYIDVMLVLLVIFMVTAPMISPSVIDLPSVGGTTTAQQVEPIQVILAKDESLSIEDKARHVSQPMSLEALSAYLQKAQRENPNQAVVIAADKDIRYEAVMQVMDHLQRQQIKKVGLLVQPQAS